MRTRHHHTAITSIATANSANRLARRARARVRSLLALRPTRVECFRVRPSFDEAATAGANNEFNDSTNFSSDKRKGSYSLDFLDSGEFRTRIDSIQCDKYRQTEYHLHHFKIRNRHFSRCSPTSYRMDLNYKYDFYVEISILRFQILC